VVVHATQMSVGSPAGRVVTLMVSLSPIHRPVMALHMRPVYTVLLGHGQRGLLGGRVPVPVAPVHAQKSDLWRPIRLNDTEDVLSDVSGKTNFIRLSAGTIAFHLGSPVTPHTS
jgi:hypothetical protein